MSSQRGCRHEQPGPNTHLQHCEQSGKRVGGDTRQYRGHPNVGVKLRTHVSLQPEGVESLPLCHAILEKAEVGFPLVASLYAYEHVSVSAASLCGSVSAVSTLPPTTLPQLKHLTGTASARSTSGSRLSTATVS